MGFIRAWRERRAAKKALAKGDAILDVMCQPLASDENFGLRAKLSVTQVEASGECGACAMDLNDDLSCECPADWNVLVKDEEGDTVLLVDNIYPLQAETLGNVLDLIGVEYRTCRDDEYSDVREAFEEE